SDFMENIESQLDFIFSIGSPRTNFSSQNVSSTGNQENDDLIITPGVETGLID
ncbi:hypothetical protein WUBG_06607, partial [Wuchereria bancrofti]